MVPSVDFPGKIPVDFEVGKKVTSLGKSQGFLEFFTSTKPLIASRPIFSIFSWLSPYFLVPVPPKLMPVLTRDIARCFPSFFDFLRMDKATVVVYLDNS